MPRPWTLMVKEALATKRLLTKDVMALVQNMCPLAPNSVVEVDHPPSPLAEAPLPKRGGFRPIYDGEGDGSNLVTLGIS
mgnify:CR=1 FL=1